MDLQFPYPKFIKFLDENTINDDTDMIGALPDSLLSHILSLIPTKQAVRTSILSNRWRSLWNSVTNFEFDDELLQHYSKPDQSDKFDYFVNTILSLQTPPIIDKFSLKCGVKGGERVSHVNSWISTALARHVKELDLRILPSKQIELPENLFTSDTLVVLKLDSEFGEINFNSPVEVASVRLPNLKVLHLLSVIYTNDESVENFFRGCPVLEELLVERRKWDNVYSFNIFAPSLRRLTLEFTVGRRDDPDLFKLQIDAPMLEYLNLRDYMPRELIIEDLSSVTEAHFTVKPHDEDYADNVLDLLRGLSRVEYLSLSASTMMAIGSATEHYPPVFNNITRLEIGVEHQILFPWSTLPESWDGLEVFVHHEGLDDSVFESWWLQPPNMPQWLWDRLTTFDITVSGDSSVSDDELTLLKRILKNAKVLKRMTIHTSSFIPLETKFELLQKISMFRRQSEQCRVEFR